MFYPHVRCKRHCSGTCWFACFVTQNKPPYQGCPDFPSSFTHAEHYESALSVLFGFLLFYNGNLYWYYKDCSKRYSLSFLSCTCNSAKVRYGDYSYLQSKTVIQRKEHGVCIKGFSLPSAMRRDRIRALFSYRSLRLKIRWALKLFPSPWVYSLWLYASRKHPLRKSSVWGYSNSCQSLDSIWILEFRYNYMC